MSAPELDESTRHDHGRLLWNLALAGAQVRRAEQVAPEWRPEQLDLGGPPRALLVATDAPTSAVGVLLAALAVPVAPVAVLDSPDLPRWVGASDAMLVVSLDGRHPRLLALTEQAERRGVSLAVVAPAGSPVAVAAGRGVVAALPADVAVRAAFWSVLGPALLAAQAWGVTPLRPGLLTDVATALDEVAHRCRPGSDAVANPARALAEDLAHAVPVVVGAGPLAGVAATVVAAALRVVGAVPALAVRLPDELVEVTALLVEPARRRDDDFFRDRVDEPEGTRPRLVVIGDDEDDADGLAREAAGWDAPRPDATEREAAGAAGLVHRYAEDAGVRATTVDVPAGDAMVRFAGAVLLGHFTAAYLALGRDLDPSAPRPGELL